MNLFIESYKLINKTAQARLEAMDPKEPVPSPFLFVLPANQTEIPPTDDKTQQIGATSTGISFKPGNKKT